MGSWGTGIVSDDFAADIRGEWRDAIIEGDDPAEVTRRLVEQHGQNDGEPEVAAVFWLALAAAQMETGRLDSAVLARQREKVLARLAEKLRAPQPAPKRLRRTTPLGVSFDAGDAVRLRTDARAGGVYAIVVGHHDGYPKGVVDPVVELVVWDGDRPPSTSQLAQLPCVLSENEQMRADWPGRIRPHMFILNTPTKKHRFGPEMGDVVAHGVPRSPVGDPSKGAVAGGSVFTSWTTWRGLIKIVEGDKFRRDVDLTRQHQSPSKRRFFRR